MRLNTKASVHLAECSFFKFYNETKKLSLIFSVVRVHLAKQSDPFRHTLPIGQWLSMADIELCCGIWLYFTLVRPTVLSMETYMDSVIVLLTQSQFAVLLPVQI